MRIWSLHPKHLDTKGLVALWREALLAKNVLEDKTKGYKNHPQLNRFKTAQNPINAINFYLKSVWIEAKNRNFNFDKSKFEPIEEIKQIDVSIGQINFEKKHLLNKLKIRDKQKYDEFNNELDVDIHPLFNCINGEIELWEKL
jgi:hypothetical protein